VKIWKILFTICAIFFLGGVSFFAWKNLKNPQKIIVQEIIVETERKEYTRKDKIKLKIKNESSRKICFSSCYPYFFQRKEKNWESYIYGKCRKIDFIEICLEPKKERYFEIENLSYLKKGLHRLSIPICVNCKIGNLFSETQKILSNEFLIK